MGIIDNAKDVVSLVQKIDNLELYRKILDLQSEITKLVGKNTELKRQVKDLTEKLEFHGTLEHRDGAYWKADGAGPFCMRCWGKERALRPMNGTDVYGCPVCGYNHITEAHASFIDDEIGRFNQSM